MAITSPCSSCRRLAPRTVAPGVAASQKVRLPSKRQSRAARREGVETISGRMTLAFGAVSIPVSRERSDAVHFLELILARRRRRHLRTAADPGLDRGIRPDVPGPERGVGPARQARPRWQLLLGKYLGVLTFVGFQVVLFVVLTWLALGVRTQVWDLAYWWCIPLLLVQFAIFYSFSVLLAVVTRSTVACVFGSMLFWLLAWGINYGSVMARGAAGIPSICQPSRSPWPRWLTGSSPSPLTRD